MHGKYNIIISVLACEVIFIGALCTIYCIHQLMTIRLLANRFSRMQIFDMYANYELHMCFVTVITRYNICFSKSSGAPMIPK